MLIKSRMGVHPPFLRHPMAVLGLTSGLDLDEERFDEQLFHLARPGCAVGLCGVFFLSFAGHCRVSEGRGRDRGWVLAVGSFGWGGGGGGVLC